MALNPVYLDYGLQTIQGFSNFMIAGIEADLAATLQRYRNQVLKIQESMNANRITANEINTQDAAQRLDFAIQAQAHQDQGFADVAAASAGVRGASVDATMRGLRRSAAFAQQRRRSAMKQEMVSHFEDRRSNAMATALSMDITVQQKPSILSAAIGVAANLLDTYQDNRTATQKAGPSSIKTPSSALGLGAASSNTLIDPNNYWKILPDVGG